MKKVLLVDDSHVVRQVERRIVESMGVEILEAQDGQDALRVFHEGHDIDAIILDWHMPVMSGIEFLKTLRSGQHSRPFVVMCTESTDKGHISEALAAGADEYIMKPFTGDIVREKLQGAGVL